MNYFVCFHDHDNSIRCVFNSFNVSRSSRYSRGGEGEKLRFFSKKIESRDVRFYLEKPFQITIRFNLQTINILSYYSIHLCTFNPRYFPVLHGECIKFIMPPNRNFATRRRKIVHSTISFEFYPLLGFQLFVPFDSISNCTCTE